MNKLERKMLKGLRIRKYHRAISIEKEAARNRRIGKRAIKNMKRRDKQEAFREKQFHQVTCEEAGIS